MAKTNTMFIPLIELVSKIGQANYNEYSKTMKMIGVLLFEMPQYEVRLKNFDYICSKVMNNEDQ